MKKQTVIFQDLGRADYLHVWDYQEQLLQKNVQAKSAFRNYANQYNGNSFLADQQTISDKIKTINYLLFVEHPPVYTLGKSGKEENLLIAEHDRTNKGIQYFKTNRGGDITFHGPEQIVGYPILDLENFYTDIGKYLRNLEEIIILTMAEYGLKGERSAGETGVWMDASIKGKERKICAIGVRCSRWITMHGFAFNINTDLTYFDHIIPCGIQNKQVTSLEKELGGKIPVQEVKEKLKRHFEKVFEVELRSESQYHLKNLSV